MQKLEPLHPDTFYVISQCGNNGEAIFPEKRNQVHFLRLAGKHLAPVCELLDIKFRQDRVEMIVRMRALEEVPPPYRQRLHLPFSNLFNSYAKAVNKRYGRCGSLFQVRFERRKLSFSEMGLVD